MGACQYIHEAVCWKVTETLSLGFRNCSHLKIDAKGSHFMQKASMGWREIETTISVKEKLMLKRK